LVLPRRLLSHWLVFAGVVVVFRREAVHEWSGIDKLRLRLLLSNSILPLGLSMLGLLLLTIKPMAPGIWRWCSGILLVATVSFVTATTKDFRRLNLPNAQLDHVTRFVFFLSGIFGAASHAPAIVQHCVARGVLAIFRGYHLPTRHGDGPICPDDPSAARINAVR
jgi:hypothetical protein